MSEISDDEGIDVQEHVRKEVISPVLTGIKGSVKTFLIHLIFEEHGEDRFISGIDVMFPLTSERLSLQNIVPIHLGNEKYEALGFYESGGAWIRNQSEANKKALDEGEAVNELASFLKADRAPYVLAFESKYGYEGFRAFVRHSMTWTKFAKSCIGWLDLETISYGLMTGENREF